MQTRHRRARGLLVAVASAVLAASALIATSTPASAATTVLIGDTSEPFRSTSYRYTDAGCGSFEDPSEVYPSPFQTFEEGPETPPAGTGSLQIVSQEDSDPELYRTAKYDGTVVADLTALGYSTFVETEGGQPPSLRLHIDYKTAGDDGPDGAADEILLFIPANQTAPVTAGEWQTWNALAGNWNVNGDPGDLGAAQPLDVLLTGDRADAKIVRSFDPASEGAEYDADLAGGVTFFQGCAGANATDKVVNLDKIVVNADTYDLEKTNPATPTGANGYRMVATDGGIFTFGKRQFWGSTGSMKLNRPIVGGATDVSDYEGYWMVASDGGVFNFSAPFHGSLGSQTLPSPAVEIEPTATGDGYWIVLANGKVHNFGAAKHFGDMSTKGLNKPVIGMSVAPDGNGYWLVAEDGGIFNFGSAGFFGSMGDKKLNAPVIDLAPTPDGAGYYLVAKDGGVFSFGSAVFKGSTGSMTLNQPVVAMLVNPTGTGYWLAASDGGIFTFGANIEFLGSMGSVKLNGPVLDLIN